MAEDLSWLSLLHSAGLFAMLLIAVVNDVLYHRIPNKLLAPALAIALSTSAFTAIDGGLLMSLTGLAIGLAMLMPLYVLGAMGAGDVKLLGVAGAFLGPAGTIVAGLATFIVGGIYGLLWIGLRQVRAGKFAAVRTWFANAKLAIPDAMLWLASSTTSPNSPGRVAVREAQRKDSTFAYAPAIALGVAVSVWRPEWSVFLTLGN